MSPLWSSLYDKFKDCRYGALFLSTILACIGLLISAVIIAAALRESGLEKYSLAALSGLGILVLAWGSCSFRRARTRHRAKLRHDPLSRDELCRARSKLKNGMKLIQSPAPRVPDIDLKY
jgi:hypothetical protein